MNQFHRATIRVISMLFAFCGVATFLAPVAAFMSVTSDAKKEASLLATKYGAISLSIGAIAFLVSCLGSNKKPDVREKDTSKFAITSIVLGIPFIGLPTFLIGSALGVIFAILAFRDVYSKGIKKGADLAYVGAFLSVSTIAMMVPVYFVGAG